MPLITLSCNDTKTKVKKIDLETSLKAQFNPNQISSLSELKASLKVQDNYQNSAYQLLLQNNSKFILDNLHSFQFSSQGQGFYQFPNPEVSFSNGFKHNLQLQGATTDATSATHIHFNSNVKFTIGNGREINKVVLFDSNNPSYSKIGFIIIGYLVFKIEIDHNNVAKLSNLILYFKYPDKSLEVNSNLLNKFFNPQVINQELVNEYEQAVYSGQIAPAVVLMIK
ncbi:hypothetical protein [Mycoplasmopsis gallopavonis]|uniref:hypothetical protein n=1 Tax=Mycoplasmopsis gallopavonis TaxID=76629 RepID=UPI00101C6D0B|nr:hypothetical protein [Mycoplasmopsis gallopavonis]